MNRFVARCVLVVVVAVGFSGTLLTPPAVAHCGVKETEHFCAYDQRGFEGIVIHSDAPRGTSEVDVANDVVSSGRNGSNNHWCGMTNRVLLPPAVVFDFGPETGYRYIGDEANNRIDWFNVRGSC
jgi:hypothetical protein